MKVKVTIKWVETGVIETIEDEFLCVKDFQEAFDIAACLYDIGGLMELIDLEPL